MLTSPNGQVGVRHGHRPTWGGRSQEHSRSEAQANKRRKGGLPTRSTAEGYNTSSGDGV